MADIGYSDANGVYKTVSIDVVQAMYNYANKTASSVAGNNKRLSDPGFMFLENRTNRFTCFINGISELLDIRLHVYSDGGGTLNISSISAALVVEEGPLKINTWGEYEKESTLFPLTKNANKIEPFNVPYQGSVNANITFKSIDKSINIDKSIDGEPSKQEYGNKDVNELMRYWQERIGTKPSQNPANRRACATLIRQKGMAGAKDVVDLINSAMLSLDTYAPSVASFTDLYGAFGKLAKLEAFRIRLEAKNASQRKLSTFYRNSTPTYDEPSDEDRAKTSEEMKKMREKLFGK